MALVWLQNTAYSTRKTVSKRFGVPLGNTAGDVTSGVMLHGPELGWERNLEKKLAV